MTSPYQVFAQELEKVVQRKFRPFNELIDCRRYSFPMRDNLLKRVLLNLEYFIFNYLAMLAVAAVIFLFTEWTFSIGLAATILFWSIAYKLRDKLIEESPTNMCYNTKMTFFLILNCVLMWSFFEETTLQFIGITPVLLHAILFEPVQTQIEEEQVDQQVHNQVQTKKTTTDIEQHPSSNQIISEFGNSVIPSTSFPVDYDKIQEKMNDEMAQAYQQQEREKASALIGSDEFSAEQQNL